MQYSFNHYLEFALLDQMKNQNIILMQFMSNREPSPSSTQSILFSKILSLMFKLIFIHQNNSFIMLWQMHVSKVLWKTLPLEEEFRNHNRILKNMSLAILRKHYLSNNWLPAKIHQQHVIGACFSENQATLMLNLLEFPELGPSERIFFDQIHDYFLLFPPLVDSFKIKTIF